MSLALFVAHRSSNDKCPELPAGQFFTGAQIPSCIFVDVWPIDLIRGILRNSIISTSTASSVVLLKVAVICELKYESVSGVTPNYLKGFPLIRGEFYGASLSCIRAFGVWWLTRESFTRH